MLYREIEILEEVPNWRETPSGNHAVDATALDTGSGAFTVRPNLPAMVAQFEFSWFLDGYAEIGAYRAWLDRRRGRKHPVWVPSQQVNLVLLADVPPFPPPPEPPAVADPFLVTIEECGYATDVWPVYENRRDLAFRHRALGNWYARVTDAVSNGDGTETLTLDAGPAVEYPAAETVVNYLLLMRLDSDSASLAFSTPFLAESTVLLTEVPWEVPVDLVGP